MSPILILNHGGTENSCAYWGQAHDVTVGGGLDGALWNWKTHGAASIQYC